jgi:hypothetical protein
MALEQPAGCRYRFIYKELRQCCYSSKGQWPGNVIFDIGSHVGMFTRSRSANDLRLYFEPVPNTYACLKRNLLSR